MHIKISIYKIQKNNNNIPSMLGEKDQQMPHHKLEKPYFFKKYGLQKKSIPLEKSQKQFLCVR